MAEEKQKGLDVEEFQPEDTERVLKIAKEIIEPALREAMSKAKDQAPPLELLSALSNSYGGLLVDLLGSGPAAKFMKAHAEHIASREES